MFTYAVKTKPAGFLRQQLGSLCEHENVLQKALTSVNISLLRYKGHSIRSRPATHRRTGENRKGINRIK